MQICNQCAVFDSKVLNGGPEQFNLPDRETGGLGTLDLHTTSDIVRDRR